MLRTIGNKDLQQRVKNQSPFPSYFILQSCLYLSEVTRTEEKNELQGEKSRAVLNKYVCSLESAWLPQLKEKAISFHIDWTQPLKGASHLALGSQ